MSNRRRIVGNGFTIFVEGYFDNNDYEPKVEIVINNGKDGIVIDDYVANVKAPFNRLLQQLEKISNRQYIP